MPNPRRQRSTETNETEIETRANRARPTPVAWRHRPRLALTQLLGDCRQPPRPVESA